MLTTPVFFLRGETDNLLRTVLQDGQEILHGLAADEADHHWPVVVRHSGLSSKWIMVEDYYISCHRRAIDEPFSLAVQGVGDGEIELHWGCAGQHHLLPLASRRQGLLYVSREKLEFRDLTIECFEVDEGHVVISCLPGVENPSAHRRVRHLPREVYVSISCLPGAENPLALFEKDQDFQWDVFQFPASQERKAHFYWHVERHLEGLVSISCLPGAESPLGKMDCVVEDGNGSQFPASQERKAHQSWDSYSDKSQVNTVSISCLPGAEPYLCRL